MAYKERLYKHFCMGERCERCPPEKLQVWGTTAPDTSLLLLLGPNSQGQLGTTLVFQDLWNANMVLFASWPFTQNICSSITKRKHSNSATSSTPASFCQESEATFRCHHETAWLLWWCLGISGWCPQAADATALYAASCLAQWTLHGWETSTGENFGQTEGGKKMGTSSALESRVELAVIEQQLVMLL